MIESRSISRRALVKTTAWSMPVIAIATAAPLASASDPVVYWDVTMVSFGQDGYASYYGKPLGSLGVNIIATHGTIPIGTQFQVAHSGILVNLRNFPTQGLFFTVQTDAQGALLTLNRPIAQGEILSLDFMAEWGRFLETRDGTITVSLLGPDNPPRPPGGANSVGMSANVFFDLSAHRQLEVQL